MLAALVPTIGVIFAAGKQMQKVKELESDIDSLKGIDTKVARIEERLRAHTENTNAALQRIESKLDR